MVNRKGMGRKQSWPISRHCSSLDSKRVSTTPGTGPVPSCDTVIRNSYNDYDMTRSLKVSVLCYVMLCYVMLCYVMLCYLFAVQVLEMGGLLRLVGSFLQSAGESLAAGRYCARRPSVANTVPLCFVRHVAGKSGI
jgi:hypothetical protein